MSTRDITTQTSTNFHPELDDSELLDDEKHTNYQSLIGVLQCWLGWEGLTCIAFATSTMAKFSAALRVKHFKYVLGIFSYLKSHEKSRCIFDHNKRDWSHRSSPIMTGRMNMMDMNALTH